MQRRTEDQKVERFLAARAGAEAAPIRYAIANFTHGIADSVVPAYVKLNECDLRFLGDRDADLWIPLFALCSIVAPDRMAELKKSAVALSTVKADDDVDDSLPLKLLADIKTVWPKGQSRWETAALLDSLKTLNESPWLEYELSPRKLARLLRPFEVEARTIRTTEGVILRGYERASLDSAFSRYLDS